MELDINAQIASFQEALAMSGTQQRAEYEKAYLKSDLDFYGTAVPVISRFGKTFRKAHPDLTHDQLLALVEGLWQTSYHEARSLGLALLDQYPQLLGPDDSPRLEALIRRMNTWAHVDWMAGGAVAYLVQQYDDLKQQVLPQWAIDENFWVRRTALLALLKTAGKHREDFDRFAQFASQMIDEKEFFIRKAIGWVLREVSKKQPDWTCEFLWNHRDRVSGLTLREGAKYLPPAQRDELLDHYRQRTRRKQ